MPRSLNEYAPEDPVAYTALRRFSNEDGDAVRASDIHLASVAEKRRLWWRNAVINAFFIAAW
jgi:solute carrier family 35 protein C2